MPPAPADLAGRVARRAWRELGLVLIEARVLTVADLTAFGALCAAVQDLSDARRALAATGPVTAAPSGYPVLRPEASLVRQASRELRAWLEHFGLTPSSRRRVAMLTTEDESEGDLD
jgi:P27 family predicted phage terminase small subunit